MIKRKFYFVLSVCLALNFAFLSCEASFASSQNSSDEESSSKSPKKRSKPSKLSEDEEISEEDKENIPSLFSDPVCKFLKENKVSFQTQTEIYILNQALYLENPKDVREFSDPNLLESYVESGSNIKRLNRKLTELTNNGQTKPIRSQACQNTDEEGKIVVMYSPVVRIGLDTPKRSERPSVRKILTFGKQKKPPLIKSIPRGSWKEDEREETEEEKVARKEFAKQFFLKAEQKRGNSLQDLSDSLAQEKAKWSKHFAYFKERKKDILRDGRAGKIRRKEIEETFKKTTAKSYQKLKVGKHTLYYDPDMIDLERQDEFERSNRQRLAEGLCPIGADGNEMNYHHLTHHDPGIIVLLSDTLHTKKSGKFHYPKKFYIRPKAVDRPAFAAPKQDMSEAILKNMTAKKKTTGKKRKRGTK